MLTGQLSIVIAYLSIQVGIGIWAGRSIKSAADFLLAGRRLGTAVATFTLFATWYGAEAGIGAAGTVFTDGITGARVEPFGYTVALLLCGLVLARALRSKSYVTLGDFFADRFGPAVEKVAVLILVPSTLIWTSAQILAFAQILMSAVGVPLQVGLAVAVAVVILYSSFGGLLGSAYTDVVQGVVLIVGMIVLLIYSLQAYPGSPVAVLVQPQPRLHESSSLWAILDSWAIPILGSLASHELVSRILATKSPAVARRATLYAAAMYFVFGLIPVVLGLLGPGFDLEVSRGDQFLPALAGQVLPGPMHTLFVAAMISAILSTADSTLITATGLVTQNLFQPLFSRWGQRRRVFVNRLMVVSFGLIVLALASSADRIYDLLIMASSTGTAGVLVTVLCGLRSSTGGAASALACLGAGVVFPPLFEQLGIAAPYLSTVGVCLLVYLLVDVICRIQLAVRIPKFSPQVLGPSCVRRASPSKTGLQTSSPVRCDLVPSNPKS